MAEFLECYYIRAQSTTDAIELLERAGIPGFIVPPSNGWVGLLVEGLLLAPNRALVEANTGLMLHFLVAEDHGWRFELYQGPTPVSRFSCVVENGVMADKEELHLDRLVEFISKFNPSETLREELHCYLDPGPETEVLGFQSDADGFAALLQLPTLQPYSYEDLLMVYDQADPSFQSILQVK